VCGSTSESDGCYASGSLGRSAAWARSSKAMPATQAMSLSAISMSSTWRAAPPNRGDALGVEENRHGERLVRLRPGRVRALGVAPSHRRRRANCYVVENTSFLYVGTDQGGIAVQVRKSNLALIPIGGAAGGPITSITATDEGYITIAYGGPNELGAGFLSFDPTGNELQDGGGYSLFLNSRVGLSTFNIPSPPMRRPLRRFISRSWGAPARTGRLDDGASGHALHQLFLRVRIPDQSRL